ncbi:MAG: AAA family ATPase [Flammeovirgaceae bacterium]
MATTNRPVIFLAFANDRVDDAAYLRNLPKELDGIRKALYRAQEAGLCEVVERANVTVENILNVFQDARYRNRIAIFHYGGHANGYQLLLESVEGANVSAKSEGLVPFFAKQRSLKLIFLNGCSSQQQALALIESGLPAVIGTSQSINDDVATSLAIRFYNGLGNGAGIEKAWQEAVDEVKIQKGTANMRDLFFDGMEALEAESSDSTRAKKLSAKLDRFPWEVYYKPGAEIVKAWNLPEQVGNPLFNLPEIPQKHNLPESPFLFLKRYERKHARVFFGRSYYIRDLYNKITDVSSPPIILLYGQSGVGKSSLFDAGIYPRLEESHNIKYIRRDGEIGLVNGLKRALHTEEYALDQASKTESEEQEEIPEKERSIKDEESAEFLTALEARLPELSGEVKKKAEGLMLALKTKLDAVAFEQEMGGKQTRRIATEAEIQHLTGVLKQWRTIEARTGKPLVIILDQAEELFTRPIANQPNELEELLDVFDELFANPIDFPRGKIVMGYRKEYNPEIEEGFKVHSLPRTKIFLEHLSRKDIIEIFRGLTDTPAVKKRYQLTVEKELPVIIADDLLEDKNSSVAPVLQILLTKMWSKAKAENADAPSFTVELYQGLRREGILLDDFYFQQMEKLRNWAEELEMSGFALSVLQFHTTKLATAGSRHIDEIRTRYKHREKDIDTLIEKFQELYLLNESGRNVTGLAHDTIAPLIQNEYRISERPGQRAARILENKTLEFKRNPKTSLDIGELELVETGQVGMRYWVDREWELVEKSRIKREKAKRMRRLLFRGIIATTIFVVLGFIYGVNKSLEFKDKIREKSIASLGEKSRIIRDANPTLGLILAKRYQDELSSIKENQSFFQKNSVAQNNSLLEENAKRYLKEAIVAASGKKLYKSVLFTERDKSIESVAFSEDEKLIVTTSIDNVLTAWDIEGNLIDDLRQSTKNMATAVFRKDSIVLAYEDGSTRVLDKQGDTYRKTSNDDYNHYEIWHSVNRNSSIFSKEERRDEYARDYDYCVATEIHFSNYDKDIHFPIDLISAQSDHTLNPCSAIGARTDGSEIAFKVDLGYYDSLFDIEATRLAILNTQTNQVTELTEFDGLHYRMNFHPTAGELGVYVDGDFHLFNQQFEKLKQFKIELGMEDTYLQSWAFIPEKQQIAFMGRIGGIVVYSYEGEKLFEIIHQSAYSELGFSPSGRYCYKVSPQEGVHIWDVEAEDLVIPAWKEDKWLKKFFKRVSVNARFSSDGKYIIDRLPNDSIVVGSWRDNVIKPFLAPIDSFASKQLFYHENGVVGHLSNSEDMMLQTRTGNFMLYGNDSSAHEPPVLALDLSDDGQKIYVGHANMVMIMNSEGEKVDSLPLTSFHTDEEEVDSLATAIAVSSMNIDQADEYLLVERNSLYELYHLPTKEVVHEFYEVPTADKIALSSDAKLFATLIGSELALWDLSENKVDNIRDTTFINANDILFSEDNKHVYIFNSIGIYSWGSSRLLLASVDQIDFSKPSLRNEVDELLDEQVKIRGLQDVMARKIVYFAFIFMVLALIFLNKVAGYFDEKNYLKFGIYGPAFGTLLFIQADLIADTNTRGELRRVLDYLVMINLPIFVYLTYAWFKKFQHNSKVISRIYLSLLCIGAVGASVYLYYDYYSLFNDDFLWEVIFAYLGIVISFVLINKAVSHWYLGNKVKFLLFIIPGIFFLMFLFIAMSIFY